MRDSVALRGLTNIGPTIAGRLAEIGVRTVGDLRAIGPAEAYRRVAAIRPGTTTPVCYYLYSLQGALDGKHWDALPSRTKQRLAREARLDRLPTSPLRRVPSKRSPRTNAEYSQVTRRQLLAAARREFASRGYGGASTESIVEASALTRGALYHHYRDKQALFEAVFVQLESEIAARISGGASHRRDPFEDLRAGCDAWLDACLEPDVRRIVLLDGPSVLGWQRWMQIDARYGARLLRQGIDACIAAGVLVAVDAAVLTHLLSGAMNEIALVLAESKNPRADRRRAGQGLRALIHGLRRPSTRAPGRRRSTPSKRTEPS